MIVFNYHRIITKLTGEYNQDFKTYGNERLNLFGLGTKNHDVKTNFPRDMKEVKDS